MPLRVDFLGPPGVGKSTLCNAVLRQCSESGKVEGGGDWISMARAIKTAEERAWHVHGVRIGLKRRPVVLAKILKYCFVDLLSKGEVVPPALCFKADVVKNHAFYDFLEQNHQFVSALAESWF